ncbi:hypothetical protein ACUXPF_003781, partial [Sphingomonas sanguinis]
CRPIMSVIPCRLPRVNHASIAVASTRFSTVSSGFMICLLVRSEASDKPKDGATF